MLPIKYKQQFEDYRAIHIDTPDLQEDIEVAIARQRRLARLNARYANVATRIFWRQLGLDGYTSFTGDGTGSGRNSTVAMNNRALMLVAGSSGDVLFTRRLCQNLQMSQWREVVSAHQCPVACIDVDTSERRYLLSAGVDATIALYDLEDDVGIGEPLPLSSQSTQMDNTAEEMALNAGSRAHLVQYKKSRLEALFRVRQRESHAFSISCISWYPHDTGMFATGSFDRFIRLWDTNRLETVHQFKFPDKVYALSMSPVRGGCHSVLIAGASRHQNVRLCDMATGAFVQALPGHKGPVMDVKFSPTNEHLMATASADHTVRIWDVRKAGWIYCLDQSHTQYNPKQSHTEMKRFSTRKYHPKTEVPTAHNGIVNALCFTPDGRYLITAGKDNCLRRWDLQTGENTLVTYPGIVNASHTGYRFAVSSDGSTIYHPNNSTIGCYDTKSGKLVGQLRGHYGMVASCVFHAREQELLSAGSDWQIFIWSPERRNASLAHDVESSTIAAGDGSGDDWSDDEHDG